MKDIKNEFPAGGLIIISILGLLGLTGIIYNIVCMFKYGFLNAFSGGGVMLLAGIVFLSFSLVVWIAFIRNILIKPKTEVLFLLERKRNELTFINKKGRKFHFTTTKEYQEHRFYQVLKTHDYIVEIKEESQDDFPLKLKDSYWLNWYSPYGDFGEILLLPIPYFLFSLFFFGSLLSSIPINFVLGAIGIYPLYLIVYDIKKKIEKNKKNQEYINSIIKSDK